MKYLKQTLTIALIALNITLSHAQKTYQDTLSVKIDNKIEVGLSIYNYSDLKDTVEDNLEVLNKILKDNNNIPVNLPYTIIYEPHKKLSIKEAESKETVIWENGKQKPYKFTNTCKISAKSYFMIIEFNELEDLTSEDFINRLKEAIDATITNQNRYSRLFNYEFKEGSMASNEDNIIGKRGDMISIKAGVGANLIKNQPVIDLSGELAFVFQKKGISKNQYYLTYNLLYDFIDNSKTNLNSFLNLGYRYNLSNNRDDSDWLGVEFGYLISREGDMFDKDTFRFGFNWEVGNSITISPQLYISSEQTFPGLRIGFGF
jgi:hypothetical protein